MDLFRPGPAFSAWLRASASSSLLPAAASLAAGAIAFGLAGTLAVRAHAIPILAFVQSVLAFVAVLCVAHWAISALEALRRALPRPRPDRDQQRRAPRSGPRT